MKPTIYKPGAYNSPGVYKGAGGIYKGTGVYKDGGVGLKIPLEFYQGTRGTPNDQNYPNYIWEDPNRICCQVLNIPSGQQVKLVFSDEIQAGVSNVIGDVNYPNTIWEGLAWYNSGYIFTSKGTTQTIAFRYPDNRTITPAGFSGYVQYI